MYTVQHPGVFDCVVGNVSLVGKVLPLDGNFVGLDKLLRVDKLFRLEGEPVGCVYLVDIVAPGRGEAFEEEHEEDVLLGVPNLYTKIVCILPAHGTLSHSKLHGWYLEV